MSSSDIVVVGGGIIGLSIALKLAQKGQAVTVVDANERGQASYAAAGMLAPLGEAQEQSEFVPFAIKALRYWPAFVDDIKSASNVPLKLNGPGILRVGFNQTEEDELVRTYNWQQHCGLPVVLLDQTELHKCEPNLAPNAQCAIRSAFEPYVEPQLVLTALRAACDRLGVTILMDDTVIGFAVKDGDVTGVRTTGRTFDAPHYVVAGGAWSRTLLQQLDYELPVHPVRGQIVSIGPLPSPLFQHTIFSKHGYLVPRHDGRVLIGATEEQVGFDSSTTESGVDGLYASATSLVPALRKFPIHSSWAGLRPVSKDRLPLIGFLPGRDNVTIAAGHGRNGILMAPYTGILVADSLLKGAVIPDVFSPLRFEEQL